jgi:hypothetical protein
MNAAAAAAIEIVQAAFDRLGSETPMVGLHLDAADPAPQAA